MPYCILYFISFPERLRCVCIQKIFYKIYFLTSFNFKSQYEIQINDKINYNFITESFKFWP
jgi:hypothetical protein